MVDAPHSILPGERPKSVTLVAWGVFLLGMVNGWRAIVLFRQRGLLYDLGVTLDPAYIAAAALVWAVLFVAVAIAIARHRPSGRWLTPAILALYTLYGVVLSTIGDERATLETLLSSKYQLLILLLSIVIIVFVIWALNRKLARDYFVSEK